MIYNIFHYWQSYAFKRMLATKINFLNRFLPKFRKFYHYYFYVVFPTIIIGIYFAFIASNQYVSISAIIIKQHNTPQVSSGGLSFLTGVSDNSQKDALLVKEYIHSYTMLDFLDNKFSLKDHYQSSKVDFVSRLSKNASREEFMEYYQSKVDVEYDELSSIINITVTDFDKEMTIDIQKAIIDNSEKFINEISKYLAEKQLNFIKHEVNNAKDQLQISKSYLKSYQDKHIMVSPTAESQTIYSRVGQLENELIKEESNLKNLVTYLNINSHQVVSAQNKISVLKKQIQSERKKLAGSEGKSLNDIISEFDKLQFEVEFLSENYKMSLTSLEKARVEAMQQLKHLVLVAQPQKPDKAEYPKVLNNILVAFFMISMLYGIIKMINATIRDHIEV